jgi:hypothetical protein
MTNSFRKRTYPSPTRPDVQTPPAALQKPCALDEKYVPTDARFYLAAILKKNGGKLNDCSTARAYG